MAILPIRCLGIESVVNGGFAFDLPALKPFLCGPHGYLPPPEDLQAYAGFLDARIRCERVKRLLDSVEALTKEQVSDYNVIPGDAVIREFIGGSTVRIPHNE